MSVAKQFQGGGHILAAGATIKGNLEEVKKSVTEASLKAIKEFEAKK